MDEQFLMQLQAIVQEVDERLKKLESFNYQVIDDRVKTLEHTLNDVVIASLKEANDEYEYHMALEAFKEMHPEAGGLQEPLSALYGEDYDVYKDLYDTMQGHVGEEGFDENQYVADQLQGVASKLDAMRAMQPGGGAAEEEVVVEGPAQDDEIPSEAQLAEELAAAQ